MSDHEWGCKCVKNWNEVWWTRLLRMRYEVMRSIFERLSLIRDNTWPRPSKFRGQKSFSAILNLIYWLFLSISYSFFWIFDLKLFRVQPQSLTFRGHLWSNFRPPFEIPCMTPYPTSIDTFSLSRTVFLSYLTSHFTWFYLDLWPLKVIWGPKFHTTRQPIYDLLIWLTLTPSVYLEPLSRKCGLYFKVAQNGRFSFLSYPTCCLTGPVMLMKCNVMQCNVMWCSVMWCDVMWCKVM